MSGWLNKCCLAGKQWHLNSTSLMFLDCCKCRWCSFGKHCFLGRTENRRRSWCRSWHLKNRLRFHYYRHTNHLNMIGLRSNLFLVANLLNWCNKSLLSLDYCKCKLCNFDKHCFLGRTVNQCIHWRRNYCWYCKQFHYRRFNL